MSELDYEGRVRPAQLRPAPNYLAQLSKVPYRGDTSIVVTDNEFDEALYEELRQIIQDTLVLYTKNILMPEARESSKRFMVNRWATWPDFFEDINDKAITKIVSRKEKEQVSQKS